MNKAVLAKQLIRLAESIIEDENEVGTVASRRVRAEEAKTKVKSEEDIDPKFREKVQALRKDMSKILPKKMKKIGVYGVEVMRPTETTVEDLVDVMLKILNA